MILQVIIGLVVVGLTYFVIEYFKSLHKFREFRGPPALPIVGICYNPKVFPMFRYIASMRKSYGKIFALHVFTKVYLVILEPAVVRRVLSDSKSFPKGEDYSSSFALVFGEGLVTSGHDKHRNDRAIFNKYFIRSSVNKSMPMYNDIADFTIGQLMDEKMGNLREMEIDIEPFFARLSLRIFMNFCCGSDYRNNLDREVEICEYVSRGSWAVGNVILYSIPHFDFIPMVKYTKVARAEVWKDIKEIIMNRKKAIAAGEDPPDDCITAMLTNDMSEKDMIDHAVTLVCAGHDTTSYFASYTCLVLAENPDCQDKLREVIMERIGNRTDITPDDIAQMPYLHQVFHETLRLYAIIPNLSRVASTDVTIKEAVSDSPGGTLRDITIPKGANILIPMYLLNRDPTVWENPSKFDPSRWEGHGEYTSAKSGFFPFGYGTRTCIGNTLAQMETAVFMCHLLRRYKFKTVPGFKINILAGISLTTSNGVRLVAEKLDY